MKLLLKEITPILLLLSGTIVFGIIILVGIIYNLFCSIIKVFQVRFYLGIGHFIEYWLKLIYQVWNALKYLMLHVAIGEDLIGNAAGGKLIERLVTDQRDTLYGKGNITISAATGQQEVEGKLNKDGKWLTWALSKTLGVHHSINAYLKELNQK